jgi:prepilin-type N-terminal cleavage/methylation domain-containing protein
MRARERKGFTLIELLVVVAIIGVLSAVGYTQASVLLPRYRCYQAARDFASQVQLLKQHAATDGIEHRIALIAYDRDHLNPDADNGGSWYLQAGNHDSSSTRWEFLPTDALLDGTDDEVGMGTIDLAATHPKVSLMPWNALSGPSYSGASNADCIVFSPRGWLVNPNADFDAAGQITVSFINKAGLLRNSVEIYEVKISRAGMVRIDFNDALYASVLGNPQGIDEGSSSSSSASSGGAEAPM